MTYTPTTWVNDSPPPLSAANLNKLTEELRSQALVTGIANTLPTWVDGANPALTDAAPLNELERVAQAVAQNVGLTYTPTAWSSGWTPARNAARFNQLEQQAVANRQALTPVGAALTYQPPHYNGGGADPRLITSYTGLTAAPAPTFSASVGYTYNLNDSTDYFLDLGYKSWNAYNFGPGNTPRTSLRISGGRDVVIVGGEIAFNSNNIYDDCAGLEIYQGNSAGTVYVEGVKITSVNGVTVRTARTVVLQHVYIYARTFEDKDNAGRGGDGNHADVVQVWALGVGCSIYMDRVTGLTWYTGLTCLEAQPYRWRRNRVDLHHGQRLGESQQMGNYMNYLANGGAAAITCLYDGGSDNWMDLGYWGGQRNPLQWAIDTPSVPPPKPYYQILHNGAWTAATNDVHANNSVGFYQGDQWRCTNPATLSERWNWGKAPVGTGADANGHFAPASACGVDYVPVGYA